MFWLRVNDIQGHYFLRQKEIHEKILDLFRNDDDFKFGNFEVFTLQQSRNIIQILLILKPFENIRNIEIEIHNGDLFIKTTTEPEISDFEKIFAISETTANTR